MSKRIISTLHATLADGEEVRVGDEVDLSTADEKRLDAERALVPPNFDSVEDYHAFKLTAYRAGRGDAGAAAALAAAREGGIVDLSPDQTGGEVPEATAEAIAFLREKSPSNDETIAWAGSDPDKARAMAEAENVVSGGEPRKGVAAGLAKIIEG